jgi:hypothetical protein
LTIGGAQGEVGWTLEDNESIKGPIAKIGGQRYKTNRVYEAQISPLAAKFFRPANQSLASTSKSKKGLSNGASQWLSGF